jgi:hypothetical protein
MGTAGRAGETEAIPLTEETLSVGKRAINRGTTRIRRYVVETPVEENVSLRDETVSVERRPVAGSHPLTGAPDFSDKVVEVTETAEEAVVSKTARAARGRRDHERARYRSGLDEHCAHRRRFEDLSSTRSVIISLTRHLSRKGARLNCRASQPSVEFADTARSSSCERIDEGE